MTPPYRGVKNDRTMSTTQVETNEEWAAHFGPSLRSAREEAGMSRSQLARLLEVAEKNVANWEQGKSLPRLNYWLRIMAALPDFRPPGDMGRYLPFLARDLPLTG